MLPADGRPKHGNDPWTRGAGDGMMRRSMARAEPHHFADCLIGRVRALGHPLCVGIDPYLECIPPLFRRGDMARCAPATADAVQEFCCRIVDLVADRVAVIKPQMALFEAMMDEYTLKPIMEKLRNLYNEKKLLMAIIVQKSNEVKVEEIL